MGDSAPVELDDLPRTAWMRDLAYAAFVYVVVTACFSAEWTRRYYEESQFLAIYNWSIYEPRFVGRELIHGTHQLLDSIGLAEVMASAGIGGGEMFGAFALVNGAAFLLFASCLRELLCRTLDATKAFMAFLVLSTAVGLSFYAVSPYDALGLFLFLGCLLLAVSTGYRRWYCIPVFAIAILTRESAYLVVSVLLPLSLVRPKFVRPLIAFILAGTGMLGYLTLRLVYPSSGIVQQNMLSLNLAFGPGVPGVVAAALFVLFWVSLLPVLGLRARDLGEHAYRALLGFWILAGPYWITSAIGGIWYESLRLVMPLLLADVALRIFLKMSKDDGDVVEEPDSSSEVESADDSLVRS
jgi:hypothetical protein